MAAIPLFIVKAREMKNTALAYCGLGRLYGVILSNDETEAERRQNRRRSQMATLTTTAIHNLLSHLINVPIKVLAQLSRVQTSHAFKPSSLRVVDYRECRAALAAECS